MELPKWISTLLFSEQQIVKNKGRLTGMEFWSPWLVKYILLYFLFPLPVFGQIPHWLWAKKAGNVNDLQVVWQTAIKTVLDSSSNVYVLARQEGGYLLIENDTIAPGHFILKYDKEGNYKKVINLKFPATDIDVAADYSLYLRCNFTNYITTEKSSFFSRGESDFLLVKLDSAGKELWSITGGGPLIDYINDFCTDIESNVYLLGRNTGDTLEIGNFFSDTTKVGTFYLAKLSPKGIVIWVDYGPSVSYNQSLGEGQMLATNRNNNLLVAAEIKEPYQGSYFIAEYKADGRRELILKSDFETYGWEIRNLAVDDSQNIYFESKLFFNHYTPGGGICKIDQDHIGKWCFGGNNSISYRCYYDLYPQVRKDGISYWIGSTMHYSNYGVCHFQNDSIVIDKNLKLPSLGGSDIFITRVNRNGNVDWRKMAGGSGADHGISGAFDKFGNYYLAGTFNASIKFDEHVLISDYKVQHLFLAKLGERQNNDPDTNKVDLICEPVIFPNPADDLICWRSTCQIIKVEAYNFLGQLILSHNNKIDNKNLDVSAYPRGVYQFVFISEEETIRKKIVLR